MIVRSLSRGLWIVLVSLQLCAALARAQAQEEPTDPTERARLHFKLGVDFYRERNYRAALIEFQRAYADSPHYKLLYNLGQASLELQEDSPAIEYYTRYLKEGAAELSEARKAEVEQNIQRLRARLATVTLTTNQPGAELYVDDTLLGTAPLREPIKVSVGRRRFVAVKHGFPDAERVLDVAAGDDVKLELEFKDRAQLDLAKLEGVLAKRDEDAAPSPALWTGLATGLVATGAITLSVMTLSAQQNYDDELKVETSHSKLQDLRDDANTKALVADILWGATILGAGVTTVLLIAAGGGDSSEQKPEAKAGVALRVAAGAVGVGGRF